MNFKKLIIITLILLYSVLFLNASNTGFAFLKIPANAVSIALAGINTTIINDASSIFLNQGNLAFFTQHNANFNTISYFDGLSIYNLSYCYAGTNFTHGIGIKNLKTVAVQRTMIEGQSPITNLGDAEYYDRQFMYAISRKINESAGIGLGISHYSQKLDNIEKNTLLFDVGYKKYFNENFIHGISIKNLGQSMVFEKEKTSIPYMLTTGIYYKKEYFPAFIMDIFYSKNDSINFSVGAIISFENYFNLYFGWNSDKEIKNNFNLGLSVIHNNLRISYAFKNYDNFSDLHSLNVSLFFDKKTVTIDDISTIKILHFVKSDDLYFELVQKGQSYFEDKNYSDALNNYKKAVDIKPDYNIGIYKRIGDTYFLLKKYLEAENYYNIYREKLLK